MSLPQGLELVFHRAWSWPALCAAALGASVVVSLWNRPTRGVVGRRLSRLLAALKAVAAVWLVVWIVNPRVRYVQAKTGDAGVAVVLDSSMSMAARDALGKGRYEAARDLFLGDSEPLGPELEKKFQVHYCLFNRGLKEVERGGTPLKPDPAGSETDLAAALRALASQVRSQRLKAILLASDGNNTAGGDLRREAQRLGVPIYAIGVGRRQDAGEPWRDLGIERIEGPTRLDVGREVEFKVRLKQEGYLGENISVAMEQDGKALSSAPYQLTQAPVQTVALKYTPSVKGTQTLVFSVPHLAGDQIEENDQVRLSVAVTDRQLKVLYVEGVLRWVYKFLKRTLETEETIQTDCVMRTGGGQFYQQGKSPLQLHKALPANFDGFTQYDVIILGDFPRSFLDDTQLQMLDRWVRENKGGLLLVGGVYTLASGEYAGSALEAMMPAAFQKQTVAANPPPVKIALTAAGAAQNAMAGLGETLPKLPLKRVFQLGKVKPGAEEWIDAAEGPARGWPVLLAQRYGEGRTAVLATDSLWEMSLREGGAAGESPSARFWLQLLNWLAQVEDKGDKKGPLLIASTDRSYYESGQDVQIGARLRKPEDAGEKMRLTGEILVEGETIQSLQFPDPDLSRGVKLVWSPPYDGRFTLRLHGQVGKDKADLDLETLVGRPYRERERNALDETTLRNLARDSGGGYYTLLNARDASRAIEAATSTVSQRVEKDLLDSPTAFGLFCAVVCAEWIVRRRRNLI